MFYVKQDFGEAFVKVEIHDDNVFCTCPECGVEVPIDLAEMLLDREFDLFSTAIYCSKCSKARMRVAP